MIFNDGQVKVGIFEKNVFQTILRSLDEIDKEKHYVTDECLDVLKEYFDQ
jgi:hypothetical protein